MISKQKIVIENYFKGDCNLDTSIKEAYTKGFERGLSKARGWIPCLSSLPDDSQDVLISTDKEVCVGQLIINESGMYWLTGNWCSDYRQEDEEIRVNLGDSPFTGITAWMPLPKPYKEKEHE